MREKRKGVEYVCGKKKEKGERDKGKDEGDDRRVKGNKENAEYGKEGQGETDE